MKTIFKNLVLLLLLVAAKTSIGQSAITQYTTAGQCILLVDSSIVIDTFQMLTPPSNGTVTILPTGAIYCPDAGFIGVDTMEAYVCINTFFLCDSYTILIVVDSGSNCNLSVSVQPSGSVCIGGVPAYEAIAWGGGGNVYYQWSDGSTTPILCATTPGIYCVTATDANGCTAATCVNTQSNGCYFFANQMPVMPPLNVVLFTPVSDPTNPPVAYLWDFGDGTYDTQASPSHFYPMCDQSYYVRLVMYLTNGDSCGYDEYVYVWCDSMFYYGCQAWFTVAQDTANNMQFLFADQSVYSPMAWNWDFGDGGSSAQQNPVYTYTTPGFYNVCLTTTDSTGCTSTYCVQMNAGNVQVQDLQAYLYHYTTVTPGFPVWTALSYYNAGTISMSGSVEYRYPAGTTFTSAAPPPATHDVANRLLTWNFTGLMPYTSDYIAVDLLADVSLPLGSIAEDTMWVNPISGDVSPTDNISLVNDSVVGSWDPNDKTSSPRGIGVTGDIPMSTTDISYLVRFQNTGTAPAVNVVVRDPIDNNIDLTSLQVTNASHDHRTEIIGNELVVSFDNIYLPDSNTNEPASHGQFFIHAKLKPGIAPNTAIYNTAGIYFDFNDPVYTNTAVNTLRNAVGIQEASVISFELMPNPTSELVTLRGNWSSDITYCICSQTGQVMISGIAINQQLTINTSKLPVGLYYVQVKDGKNSSIQKLMIAR